MKLTKEQFEKLKPYAKQLRAAYKNSFLHMTGADFLKVAEIYKDVYEPLSNAKMSCNTCRLNALRKLGELYEAYENNLKAKEVKEEPVEEAIAEALDNEPVAEEALKPAEEETDAPKEKKPRTKKLDKEVK